jgi:hypothetical protein
VPAAAALVALCMVKKGALADPLSASLPVVETYK